eukprot:5460510-Prymnesium_polylepis.3
MKPAGPGMSGGNGGAAGGSGGAGGGEGDGMHPSTTTPAAIHVAGHRALIAALRATGGVSTDGQPKANILSADSATVIVVHNVVMPPKMAAAAPIACAHSVSPPVHDDIDANAAPTSEQPAWLPSAPSISPAFVGWLDAFCAAVPLVTFAVAASNARRRKCSFVIPFESKITSSPRTMRLKSASARVQPERCRLDGSVAPPVVIDATARVHRAQEATHFGRVPPADA